MRHINIPIFIPHLGCPNDCVFCNQRKISGRRGFCRDGVRDELDRAFSTIPQDASVQIAFFGGSFTGLAREDMTGLLSLANEYIDAGKCASVRLSTRPDYIDEEILQILKNYRVGTIELGIQSMDDRVLAACRRGHTAEQSRRAAALIKRYGFEFIGQMMTGLPEATALSEMGTASAICDMGADGARIYPTVVLRDTALAAMASRGAYTPLELEDAVDRTAAAFGVFEARGVPVIRIGLQAEEGLSAGSDVACGAYHPAIGELVRSRHLRHLLEAALLHENAAGRWLIVRVAPRNLSAAIGQHGENRAYLARRFSLRGVRILPDVSLAGDLFTLQITDGNVRHS